MITAFGRLWHTVRKVSSNTRRFLFGTFLMGIGHGAVWVHLNLYFRTLGLGEVTIGQIFTHVRAIVSTELLSIPFFFLLAVAGHLWVAVLAFWIRGALMNMNQPVSNAFAMEIVSEDQQAVTNSVRTFSWNFGWMVTTPLGGWLIERSGYGANMFFTIGLYLAAASLFWKFFRGRVVAPEPSVSIAAVGDERM